MKVSSLKVMMTTSSHWLCWCKIWCGTMSSAIHELWFHQTSQGLHQGPEPHRTTIKALEASLVRSEHTCQRKEYTDHGVGNMRDGYLQRQIPGLPHQVWSLVFGEKAIEQSFSNACWFPFWKQYAPSIKWPPTNGAFRSIFNASS